MLILSTGGSRARVDLAPWLSDSQENVHAAGIWLGNVFRAASPSISGVTVAFGSGAGTPANRRITAELYAAESWSSDHLRPTGAALASVEVTNPAVNARLDMTFAAPVTVSAGSLYAVIVRNTAVAPATDSFQIYSIGWALDPTAAVSSFHPYYGVRTTSGGSSWTPDRHCAIFPLYGGAYIGKRIAFAGGSAASALHGTRRTAVIITPPFPLAIDRIRCSPSGAHGTPSYTARAGVWTPSATIALSTTAIPFIANQPSTIAFDVPVVLEAGTKYYLGLDGNFGGNPSNTYIVRVMRADWQSTPPEWLGPYAYYDGTSWVETANHMPNIAAYGEVLIPSNGGPVIRPNFSGGFNL